MITHMGTEAANPTSAPIANLSGSDHIVIQVVGNDNQVNAQGKPHLTLTTHRARRGPPTEELHLLDPFRRTIELVGREADMTSLWTWLHSDRDIAVRTIIGRAGAGKTRIAVELIHRLAHDEPNAWHAGFLTMKEACRFIDAQNLSEWGWQRPTLIVLDYAAASVQPLNDWLHELADNSRKRSPLRILLLEREASKDGGWLQSLLDASWSGAGVKTLFDPVEPVRLTEVSELEKRRHVLSSTMKQAATLLKKRAPVLASLDDDPALRQSLAQPIWADPLYLMMAGLLAVTSELPTVQALAMLRTDLAFHLADRELARIDRFAGNDNTLKPALRHLAACATLAGGLSHEMATAVAVDELHAMHRECTGGPAALVDQLHKVLHRPDGGIAAIYPDIVGEAVILRVLGRQSSAGDAMLRLARRRIGAVVASLIRATQDFASAGYLQPLEWIEIVARHGMAEDASVLFEIQGYLDANVHQSTALAQLAADVTGALAQASRQLPGQNALTAFHLNNLGVRLGALGRREEALAAAGEAVNIRRELAAARPDAFRPNLAASLNNLANMLSDLGRREEALAAAGEASNVYRELAAARPDAFRPDLAASLNNLANRLSDLGRREEALSAAGEASNVYRELAAARPDAFRPDLAASLNNLANRLSDLGRREEALSAAGEASNVYRELAAARPDSFRPDLAASLNNLANMLSDLGRREEALAAAGEAVNIRRELAAARPDAFRPNLAASLNNLANRLSDLGRREEALSAAGEASNLYRELAAARPDAFRPNLAASLNNLANMLSDLGRREEALSAAGEASNLYRELAAARPDAFRPNLAASLNNLANMLSDLGRREEALSAAGEASNLYRELAAARPDAFAPNYARSLAILGRCHIADGHHSDATESFEKAATALLPAFLQLPTVFNGLMLAITRDYLKAAELANISPNELLLSQIAEQLQKLQPSPGE